MCQAAALTSRVSAIDVAVGVKALVYKDQVKRAVFVAPAVSVSLGLATGTVREACARSKTKLTGSSGIGRCRRLHRLGLRLGR